MSVIPFHVEGFPVDIALLAALFIVLVFFGIRGGKKFTVPFLMSLYVAHAFVAVLPSLGSFFLRFSVPISSAVKPYVFLGALVLSVWLLAGSAVSGVFRLGSGIRSSWQAVTGAFLSTGLFAVLFLPLLAKETLTPSSLVAQWILGDPFPFLWVLAPVVFFALLSARDE